MPHREITEKVSERKVQKDRNVGEWRAEKKTEKNRKNRKEQIKKNQKKGKHTEQREQKEEQTKT